MIGHPGSLNNEKTHNGDVNWSVNSSLTSRGDCCFQLGKLTIREDNGVWGESLKAACR